MRKAIAVFAVSLILSSCAVSKAIYLGTNDYSQRAKSPLTGESYNTENINGDFPDAVHIKTRTQTFNTYHYYILHDNRIFYKNIDKEKEPKDWDLFKGTGLPHSPKPGFAKTNAIVEISADADELMALSAEGNIYSYCHDNTLALRSKAWIDRQGWPIAEQFYFDRRTAANRSWALGKRNSHVLYYEDIFGNQHHNGTMEIATIYVLLEGGQEICYGDPGLPSDFSRNFIGPERGAFKSLSLSASASTMFVINEEGEMYTRLVDFDTIGCDPMFFKYTYIPYTSDLPGTSYFSNLNEWGLPAEGWRLQPQIPLAGKAAITSYITILQNGQGNGARELRVAGLNEAGEAGYWSKHIFDNDWEFFAVPLYFGEDTVLVTAKTSGKQGERGLPLDKNYAGFRWHGNGKNESWEYQIPNFNILEGDCDFLISSQGEVCTLKLHPLEMWTYSKRDYLPGRTGAPKMFLTTLEIPENAFESLSDAFVQQLTEQFARHHKSLFRYTIAASGNYIIMRELDNHDSLLFLTDGTIPEQYSELHIGNYVQNYGEVQRYFSPELMINRNTQLTQGLLTGKITLNNEFINELKYTIRVLKWSQLTAFKISAGYIPAHYIAKITPLRFVDVPKVRTMTSFGEKLVMANSTYINTITNSRIRVYEKIIEMLETRIICYKDMLKELSNDSSVVQNGFAIPPWYSDNISDYWNIASLPHAITGTFFAHGTGNQSKNAALAAQIPAVLSFVHPQSEHNISGWFLAIGESAGIQPGSFTIFLESRNSSKIIYSRRGKTPQQRKLQLDCTLYVNDSATTPVERDVIERCLQPSVSGISKNMQVRIFFDGKIFEIREYPARRSESLVFKGAI